MSNYPEIQPSAIKAGDTIRVEYEPGGPVLAVEYEARQDGDDRPTARAHRIVNRPTPPVELPSVPTLGRLEWRNKSPFNPDQRDRSVMAIWVLGASISGGDGLQVLSEDGSFQVSPRAVTAFTEATAVPTKALDDLREATVRATYVNSVCDRAVDRHEAIATFLAAIDEATQ